MTNQVLSDTGTTVKFKAPVLILFLFLISVLLRTQSFDNSIRGGHVWLTAHTVMTLQIWMDEGITKHNFSPIYTYDNDADRHIMSLTSGIKDAEGNYYYVSYGPFSFLFAFFVFKLFGIYPSIFSLQIMNLFIHLFTSWMIYAVICQFYRKKALGPVWGPALIGSVIYLFSMHPLWCHTYVYFADTLMQLMWTGGIYMALGLFLHKKIDDNLYVAGFGLLVFISIYTEWLALFFAGVVFCIAALLTFKNRSYLKLMGAIVVASIAALSLFVFQFASINDLPTFVEASFAKYFQRSGYDDNSFYMTQLNWQFIFKFYTRLYYPIVGMILFLLLASFASQKDATAKIRKHEMIMLMSMLIIPIILHHVIFLGFTRMHDFALLKSSILGAIVIAILYNRTTHHAIASQKKFFHILSLSIIAIMLALSLISFYDFDNFQDNKIYERVAKVVAQTASEDEALFILSEADRGNGIMVFMDDHRAISPQVQSMTKRNLLGIEYRAQAFEHLQNHGLSKGRIFTVSKKGHVINIEAITSQEPGS